MIVEKILGNRSDYPVNGRTIDQVGLEWYELEKKLMRKKTESGEEIGIRVSEHMKDGDILYADDTRLIVVDVLPADLTVVPVATMQEMGRLCFELGNRHLSLSIGEKEVSVPYDEPTFLYLAKLGFKPEKKKEKFTHFTVCHAHGNSHSHSEDTHSHSHGEDTHSHDHAHTGEGHSH